MAVYPIDLFIIRLLFVCICASVSLILYGRFGRPLALLSRGVAMTPNDGAVHLHLNGTIHLS